MTQLLEYESKTLLSSVGGLRVPRGALVTSPAQASTAASRFGSSVVVKAQVPSGGRGKGGGVHVVPKQKAAECTAQLLDRQVCGFPVSEVLIEEMIVSDRELYLAVALTPRTRSAVLLLSAVGGVDVEQSPNKVAVVRVPAMLGLRDFHVRQAVQIAGLDSSVLPGLFDAAQAVYRLFSEVEADLVEINPLFQLPGGSLLAGDVRVVPAEGGAYRRAHVRKAVFVGDRARLLGFDLVELDADGQVGLLSTGAGSSMLVVDLLTEAGARPINFCDIRSGKAKGAEERLRLVLDYLDGRPGLRCLAINFFAGVTDLTVFGEVLADVLGSRNLEVPVIARLEGTGAELTRRRLARVGVTVVDELEDLVEEVSRVVRARVAAQ